MVHEVVLFILDASASMAKRSFSTDLNRGGKNRLSYAQEAIEEIIYHLISRSSSKNTHDIGILSFHPPPASTQGEPRKGLSMDTDDGDDSDASHLTDRIRLIQPTVSFLQSLHNLFGKKCLDSSSPRVDDDVTLESYGEMDGNYMDGIFQAVEILKQRSYNMTNKRMKPRFKIVLLTDAAEELQFDVEKMDETVQTLQSLNCSLLTLGFDFLHTKIKEFASSTSSDDDSLHMEDMKEEMDDISPDVEMNSSIQMDNESFLISLTQAIGGSVFPVHSRRHLQQAVKRVQTYGAFQHGSFKKKIELIIAPDLSVSTRISILSSKSPLPRLKREVILLDSETKDEVIDGAGEYMTGSLQTTTLYWDIDNPLVQVPGEKRIDVVQFGSKDRFPVGKFDLEGLKIRSPPKIRIIGYVPSRSIGLGLLLGPTRIIFGDTKRSCTAITALSRSLHAMNLNALCTFVSTTDSNPQLGVIVPHLERIDAVPDRLLLLRLPFSDDIQNLQTISSKYPLECSEPLSQDEETACDKLIDALMLPENEASEDGYDAHFPLNPTRRLFHHFAREKATHANVSTPCSHHTYGSSMFLRNTSSFKNTSNDAKKVADKSDGNVMRNTSNHDKPGMEESEVGAVNDVDDMIMEEHDEEQEDKETNEEEFLEEDEEESLLSTPVPILANARLPLEQFRALFSLRKIPKKQRTYWSDCY